MTRDIEKEASDWVAGYGPCDTDFTFWDMQRAYIGGKEAGAKAERRWWAEKWREYSRLCQLPKDMSQQEIYKGRSAIIDELDQAAEGK